MGSLEEMNLAVMKETSKLWITSVWAGMLMHTREKIFIIIIIIKLTLYSPTLTMLVHQPNY